MTSITTTMQRLRMIPAVVLACAVAVVGWWAFDRSPPISVTGYDRATVAPGGWLRIAVKVNRDQSKRCDSAVTAVLFDSAGTRYLLSGTQIYNAPTLDHIDTISPGLMAAAAPVPLSASKGKGHVVISLSYRCNPLHTVWPIEAMMDIPFTVE